MPVRPKISQNGGKLPVVFVDRRLQRSYHSSTIWQFDMVEKKIPPAEPPKNAAIKPDDPAQKPKPAPARPHMVNDHDLEAVKKGKTRLDEDSKK